jgi:hypothetical protein
MTVPRHPAVVARAEALPGLAATAIENAVAEGSSVLVLHSGWLESAQVALALQERDRADVLREGSVRFIHRSADRSAVTAALTELGRSGDSPASLFVVHPVLPGRGPGVAVEEDPPAGTNVGSRICFFTAAYASSGGLATLLGHESLSVDGVDLRVDSPEGRTLLLDHLLELLDQTADIRRLAVSPAIRDLDEAQIERLVTRRLRALTPTREPKVTASVRVPGSCASLCIALAEAGSVDRMLALLGAHLGGEVVLQDERFRPLAWYPRDHRPIPLSELITPGRLARLIAQLRPGIPQKIRIGTPSAGVRWLMRVGAESPGGYLAATGPIRNQKTSPEIVDWLRHLAPVLSAELSKWTSWRELGSETRHALVSALTQGLLSGRSARIALHELVGTTGARVVAIGPRNQSNDAVGDVDSERGEEIDRLPIDALLDSLRVPYCRHHRFIVALIDGDVEAPLRLVGELRQLPVVLGVGAFVREPLQLKSSTQQAIYCCRLAATTRREFLDFESVGMHRLLLPGTEGGDSELEKPILRLENERGRIGFDGIETLIGYLDCGGNIRRCSHELHVHVNTLRYRLQRISDIMNVDLNDPERRFNLQLAIRLRAGRRALTDSGLIDSQ